MTEKRTREEPCHPALNEDRMSCCGCSACACVCPTGAIRMEPDEEGFLYPLIDRERCVGCLLCERVCAFKADSEEKTYQKQGTAAAEAEQKGFPGVYAAKHSDDGERMKSQSGGAFAALSEHMLKMRRDYLWLCFRRKFYSCAHPGGEFRKVASWDTHFCTSSNRGSVKTEKI